MSDLFWEYAQPEIPFPRRRALREQLVTEYLPLAEHIALRYRDRGVPVDDLVQVAVIGLINAIDRYQPERGSSFLAYAVPYARGEIQRHFRDRGWALRVPRNLKDIHLALVAATGELSQRLGRAPRPSELADHLDLPIHDVLEGLRAGEAYAGESLDRPVSPGEGETMTLGERLGTDDAQLDFVEYREALRPLIARLPERERTILLLRFYGNHTQTQIGEQMGLSQMHISRLLSQTLATLRSQLLAN